MVQTECQKPNSRYWDCCGACGGELIDSDGVVIDTYPSIYPVVCSVCGTKTKAHLTSECEDTGWKRAKQ
jgi:hypothetical protein